MRVAVVGAGVVGLSTTAALLERGVEVVCFERTGMPLSERSAGSSRIFRLAHGTPELVDRARTAAAGFARWQQRWPTRLINPVGCVISGKGVAEWASAMTAAGTEHELTGAERLRLPVRRPPSTALLDPAGGVINVDAVRALLTAWAGAAVREATVFAIEDDATVWSSAGREDFDAVLLAAGAGASPLAAQVGIYTPTTLGHHARFTFPVVQGEWACWIDAPADEPGTYQHQTGPGHWSLGGFVDPELTRWECGRAPAVEVSRQAALRYANDRLRVEPTIVETLYCAHHPGLGDGYHVHRSGSVLAIYGENLFKFAPLLGAELAGQVLGVEP